MAFFVSILSVLASIYILLQFAPKIRLRIDSEWIDPKRGLVLLRLEAENVSKVRIKKDRVFFQCLEYPLDKLHLISEWVPFATEKVIPGQEPLDWRNPFEICTSTTHLFPGERISVDRVVRVEAEGAALHLGLQFNASLSNLETLISGVFPLRRRWTTTRFLVRPS